MSKQLYSAFYQHDTGMIPLSSIYFIGDWLLWQFQRITVVMRNSNCINSNSLFIVKDRFNISQLVTVIANTHCILKQRGESEQATPKYIYSDLKILLLSRNWLPHQVPMVFKGFKMIYGDHGNMRIVKPYFTQIFLSLAPFRNSGNVFAFLSFNLHLHCILCYLKMVVSVSFCFISFE